MNTIKMIQFGPILTGRDFGSKTLKELEPVINYPVALDFTGTISLGSSFGDEIVPPIAKKQGGKITVLHANKAVWACLVKLAEESKIEIIQA